MGSPPVAESAIIHPTGDLSAAAVGARSRVLQFVVMQDTVTVGTDCRIGPHCVLNRDVVIGDRVSISGGVHFSAGVSVGNDVRIGPNCVIGGNVLMDRKRPFGKGLRSAQM